MKRWRPVLAFAVVAAFRSLVAAEAMAADAPASTVVLLRPAASDDVTTEAVARVNGELKAAGFAVAVVPATGDDARRDLEAAARQWNAIAAFAIFVRPSDAGTAIAEIWVSDRVRQRVVIQNAILHDTDRGRGAEILAVRAVELLKANLADFWAPEPAVTAPSSAPPSPESLSPSPAREAESRPRPAFASGFGAGLGVGVVESFAAMGPTWSPAVTASYGWPSGFSLRATFAGLGPAATFSAARGSATVAQALAFIEAVKTWWPRARLVPFVTAGAGTQHVHVDGAGIPPYEGHQYGGWSLLTTLGAGVAIPLVSTLSIVGQARGLAAWPSALVQVAGTDVGRVGAPSLRVDGGLFGTLP
jgi:hypothetical protein